MKSQPKSGEHNSDSQDLVENNRSALPDSLENLYDLLNELVEEDEDNEVKASSTSEEATNIPSPEQIATESDVNSNSEEVASSLNLQELNNINSTIKNSQDKPLKKTLETTVPERDLAIKSSPVRAEELLNLIEAETINQITPSSKVKHDAIESKAVNGGVSETEANSRANAQDSSPEQTFVSESPTIQHNNHNHQETSQASILDFEALDQEELAKNYKTYISQHWIVEKERQINELASSVNNLLPLIVELSKAQADNSQEYILKAIVPVIDRVIQQRSLEDQQKMAAAIANILPDAIRQEIQTVPESIGKALAPEIALSIKEQTKLNEGAIAQAMGSEMGKAIKTQIEMERDAMVDALYPVIGSTISKYMGEVVASINEKVDAALSPQGIKRKIRAKIQGVSEAELILQESVPSSIRAIFLIHNKSGLVIKELQPNTESPLESDLLAGMLTAIRSFANDCIVSNSELDAIDYDNFQILFETAGYYYLAVVVQGEPIRQFRDRMRAVFSQIVLKYGDTIEKYQGDPATIPESIEPLLAELVYQSTRANYRKPPKALYWLTAFVLGSILIPWGIIKYRGAVAHRIEQAVAVELDATPELSVYRLASEVNKGKLTLTGRVSSNYLRDLAATAISPIVAEANLELDNQIIAVNVPVDPTVTAQEVARMTKVLNQKSPVVIETTYDNQTVTIDGLILDPKEQKILLENFSGIPGVENVIFVIKQELPQLKTRIYFASGSAEFSLVADSAKIKRIKQFLTQYPLIKLKIIGHSDRKGTKEYNMKLAQARARIVYQTLIVEGIDPRRLEIVASLDSPSDLSPEQPLWLSRCVRFESFITAEEKNR